VSRFADATGLSVSGVRKRMRTLKEKAVLSRRGYYENLNIQIFNWNSFSMMNSLMN
jgi:DNA-binding Lrp family transcriptional regulator